MNLILIALSFGLVYPRSLSENAGWDRPGGLSEDLESSWDRPGGLSEDFESWDRPGGLSEEEWDRPGGLSEEEIKQIE